MIYQLFSNNTFLDTTEDFTIPINKEINDLREPDKRSSDWSKSFKLPGTAKNKNFFSHLYHINFDNESTAQFTDTFNPNYRALCEIWVDSVRQLRGFLRLIQINVTDEKEIEFECSVHGAGATLFTKLAGAKMSDLDFSEYGHTFTATNITDSWDNNITVNGTPVSASNGTGYLYGIYNDGTLTDYNSIPLNNCVPYLFAKTVVDKIFSNAGFSYSTDSFFNEDIFKRLIVSSNNGFPSTDGYAFEAQTTGSTALTVGNPVNYASETDPNNIFDLTSDTIITTTVATGQTFIYLDGNINFTGLSASSDYYVEFDLKIGTTVVQSKAIQVTSDGSGNVTNNPIIIGFDGQYIGAGKTVSAVYNGIYSASTLLSVSPSTATVSSGFKIYNKNILGAIPGKGITFNNYFTTELSQADFLKGFINLFGLYVDVDPDDETKIVALTYEDYYVGELRDWTYKLDESQALEIIPMGELNAKRYNFTYQKPEDTYNKSYYDTYNRIYGDTIVEVDNDFVTQEKKIEIPFQPSQLATIGDKTYPLIDKFGGIRLLYWGGRAGSTSWRLYDDLPTFGALPSYTTLNDYPLTLHVDDPHVPALDILFGIPFDAGLPGDVTYTDNNCYNAYWSRYIDEITDVNSKIVTGYFNITPADFQKISFRDSYFFENSYFRLNKIIDYVPDTLTKCEFLQIQTHPSFTASSAEVGRNPFGIQGIFRIGESNFPQGYKSIHVGQGIDERPYSRGNLIAASSGVSVTGNNNAVLGGTTEIVDDNAVYINDKKITGQVLDRVYHNFTGDGAVTETSGFIICHCDGAAGGITLTIPSATDNTAIYVVKNSSASYTVTIDPDGSNIEGALTKVLPVGGSTQLFSDDIEYHTF